VLGKLLAAADSVCIYFIFCVARSQAVSRAPCEGGSHKRFFLLHKIAAGENFTSDCSNTLPNDRSSCGRSCITLLLKRRSRPHRNAGSFTHDRDTRAKTLQPPLLLATSVCCVQTENSLELCSFTTFHRIS